MLKKILLLLLAALVIIQFFRPEKNISNGAAANHVSTVFPVPENVQAIFEKSCYDCHTNNTHYPWYANVQPVAWWLNDHVKEGKKEINFDEFATYVPRRQYKKLEEIIEQVKEGEMPLSSYTVIHREAALSSEQKLAITAWANAAIDQMKAKYPADSLLRKK
jgi:mono/diheme cytochrome c family protein